MGIKRIGIIGGSGLEEPGILSDYYEKEVDTPFGKPSSPLMFGKIGGKEVVIISRHGKKHEFPPSQVNYKANIFALKEEKCKLIIATSACGSLKEEIKREDFVVPDQLIDFTSRINTFFDKFEFGPIHVSLADPFSEKIRKELINSCNELGVRVHPLGTLITIEGNRFSTRAESNMFRQFADIINMSVATEASLAREAEVEYACIAMASDYDCWKTEEEPVTWDIIKQVMKNNSEKVRKVLIKTIENLELEDETIFIKNKIRTIPDFPKPGIKFRDITTLLQDREGFKKTLDILEKRYRDSEIDIIAGIESRGFIVASALASRLGKGLVLIRKPGKLPFEVVQEEYELEYGKDKVEMHKDSIKQGDKVLLVDDLIATSGTLVASCNLIKKLGGNIVECAAIIELEDLRGRQKLEDTGNKLFSIIRFKEDE